MTCPYAFRIVGNCWESRRLVDAGAAFLAYASLDERAAVNREAYLSAFCFGEDFLRLLEAAGSPRGFDGACWSAWLWFDIDAAGNLDKALADARRLSAGILERYRLDDEDLLLFFSGAKGFHVGLPTSLWSAEPSTLLNQQARRLAEKLAEQLGINIDGGVYDKVRPFRAPNSRHPKTGLHKRRLRFDELLGLSLDGILALAKQPAAFELRTPPAPCDQAGRDWQEALALVQQESEARANCRAAAANGAPRLNKLTMDFIREGADTGDRHRLLFSAAANLREFACTPALAHALLTPAALDSGLSPRDVQRQIDCGLSHVGAVPLDSPPSSPPPSPSTAPSDDLPNRLAALWQSEQRVRLSAADPPADGHDDAWEDPAAIVPPFDPPDFAGGAR